MGCVSRRRSKLAFPRRGATDGAWPDWAITTEVDTRACGRPSARRRVPRDADGGLQQVRALPEEMKASVFGAQSFYRVFSIVNGGRAKETDLFEGLEIDGSIEALRGRQRAGRDGRRKASRTRSSARRAIAPTRSRRLPDGPVTFDESPADVAPRLGSDAQLPDTGTDAGVLLREATRCCSITRCSTASALLRLHHVEPGADRRAGRFARVGGQSERRRLAAGADGDRDRGADRPLDRRADRLPVRVRRSSGQRRQHGEFRLLPCRASAPGAADVRAEGCAGAAPLRVYASTRNTYVDPEGRRPLRARHRRDPLDRRRLAAAHGRRGAASDDRRRSRGRRACPSSSSARPAR